MFQWQSSCHLQKIQLNVHIFTIIKTYVVKMFKTSQKYLISIIAYPVLLHWLQPDKNHPRVSQGQCRLLRILTYLVVVLFYIEIFIANYNDDTIRFISLLFESRHNI